MLKQVQHDSAELPFLNFNIKRKKRRFVFSPFLRLSVQKIVKGKETFYKFNKSKKNKRDLKRLKSLLRKYFSTVLIIKIKLAVVDVVY